MLRLIQLLEQCTQCIKAYLGGGGSPRAPIKAPPSPPKKVEFLYFRWRSKREIDKSKHKKCHFK